MSVKLIFISVLVGVIIFPVNLCAVEVTQIRFGQTQQRARLVVESDEILSVSQTWESGQLVLAINGLSKPITTSVFSAGASALEINLRVSADNSISFVHLPITTKSLIRSFQLPAENQKAFRLVIDWNRESMNLLENTHIANTAGQKNSVSLNSRPENPTEQLTLRQSATKALVEGNYRLAVSTLTKLLATAIGEEKEFVVEFLGVARERLYQLAFAKQYYQQFIAEFPESPNFNRVQQRLNAVIGIQNMSETKALKPGTRKLNDNKSNTRGSIRMDYRRNDLVNDLGERRQTASLANIDLDVRGDYAVGNDQLSVRFSAGVLEDFLNENSTETNRLRYANVTWRSSESDYRVDVGRQRSKGKGIFGRFDGVVASLGVSEKQQLNFVAGYPVASSKQLSLDPERSFWGVSYDWEDLWEGFDLSLFAINQTIDGLTDRQAIGGEFKILQQKNSFYGLIDYDVFYSQLNALLLSGTHTSQSDTRYNWSLNHRKSPYVSTRNALIGQSADSLSELRNLLITDEEILDLAIDRTLQSDTASFMVSQPLNSTFDISTNLTWINISGAPSSGGVPEIIETGGQYYLNFYLGGKQLYSLADTNQFGIRYSKLANSNVWSTFVNSRYRWKKSWSINAKLRFDDRSNDNGSSQQSISPGFRLQLQEQENLFYVETGAIFYTNQSDRFADLSTDIYFAYLGYQRHF